MERLAEVVRLWVQHGKVTVTVVSNTRHYPNVKKQICISIFKYGRLKGDSSGSVCSLILPSQVWHI